jgi:hypothetical protein
MVKGISYMAPGQKLQFYFGSAEDFFKDVLMGAIRYKAIYQDTYGVDHEEIFTIDISELHGMRTVGVAPLYEIKDEIKGIKETLQLNHRLYGAEGFDPPGDHRPVEPHRYTPDVQCCHFPDSCNR